MPKDGDQSGPDKPRPRSPFEMVTEQLFGPTAGDSEPLLPKAAPYDYSAVLNIPFDDSKIKTAKNTAAMAEGIGELVEVVRASLAVSQDMRDHAKEATDAANRSGKHALIIAWVSGTATLASLIVAIIALIFSSGR